MQNGFRMSLLETGCREGAGKEAESDSESYVLLRLCRYAVANLPENTIRDLNDEVNRLIRSKGHWEHRIRELGGAILDAADQNGADDDPGSALFIGGSNTYK